MDNYDYFYEQDLLAAQEPEFPPKKPTQAVPVDDAIQAKFLRYHKDNPHVYSLLAKQARLVRSKGIPRISVQFLIERLRWVLMVEANGPEAKEFRINNNFASRYARMLMEQEPDLRGMFELREIRTA